MADISSETHIALMEQDIAAQKAIVSALEKRIEAMEIERSKLLIWGILTLGGIVSALVVWIASFVKDHLK